MRKKNAGPTPNHAPGSKAPFFLAALLMSLLCIKGGRFGFIGEHTLSLPWLSPSHPSLMLPGGKFILLFSITWILCLMMLLTFPRQLSRSKSWILIIVIALFCRLALLPHEPSDDINRYLWEGRLIQEGVNPYKYSPEELSFTDISKKDPFFEKINHPRISAAYPPMMLVIFSLLARVSYTPLAMKTLMMLFDMSALGALFMLLQYRDLEPRWSILYAFNPVILYAFAGQGHFDAVMIFFYMAALICYDRKRWIWMYLFMGLAVQSKYIAVLMLPFLIRKDTLKYLWVTLLVTVLPYVPFISEDLWQPFFGLIRFGDAYAFNGSVHGLLRAALGGIQPATTLCKLLFCAILLFGYIYHHPQKNRRFLNDPISGSFFVVGVLLILAPTIHFWYITWIIPFLVLRPTKSWLILCLTISGYFAANGIYHYTGRWHLPIGVQILEWLPFWVLLFHDIYLTWHRMRMPVDSHPPRSISVVIPARNEADRISICIQALKKDTAVEEIIVVDGGSTDPTVDLAKLAGARVVEHRSSSTTNSGRGGQIHAGIQNARGDVIAIVHADTLVTAPTFRKILNVLSKQPLLAGGAVGSVFKGNGGLLRLLEFANDFRAVFFGISFGDQVQFFRRHPVVKQNLFPSIPLMEDVELSLRMHRLGRLVFLFGDALVSARRWRFDGFKRSVLVIRLLSAYLWQRMFKKPDTRTLYRRYYGKSP
ncbi:MAG: glycosyltransferase [Deltaproteobacteria bacterium]|jgi:GT2 family glycosyltransferase|nr:glycosyltransferase [Deltaproteobacteria bacterium]